MKNKVFDLSEYLDSSEMIAEYLNAALEENDNAYFMQALGHVAKAKGMAQIAEQTGLARESLYRALSGNGNTHFSTIDKVLSAIGLNIRVTSITNSNATR